VDRPRAVPVAVRTPVKQACRLLRSARASIAEIAVRRGSSRQESLTRVSREQLDTTPRG